MLQIKKIRLLPEQKTFLLPWGHYRVDSVEKATETTIKGSDAMARAYNDAFETLVNITQQDNDNPNYQGDIELNKKMIELARLADWCQRRFDQKTIAANPDVLKLEDIQND